MGEIKKATKGTPCINIERFMEDEKYDGYYCIVTNIFDEDGSGAFSDDKIIDIYRGLWHIEDSFRKCFVILGKTACIFDFIRYA